MGIYKQNLKAFTKIKPSTPPA